MKNFAIVSKLGEGAYSTVYRVKRLSDNQEYALKKVKMNGLSEKEKQNALNEVRILASIQNPNIVSYKESFFEDQSQSLCIVMDYADDGDLDQKITSQKQQKSLIPEPEIWHYFVQMVRGLQSLHELNIVHRDIKSANLFMCKNGQLKLGDMNVSKVAKRGFLSTQTGTPYYASPEVWKDKPYDVKSDIWSLGCVLYELCALAPPFQAKDMGGLCQKVLKGTYPQIPSIYSTDLQNMIRAMLQQQPLLRPNASQILTIPFVIPHLKNSTRLLGIDSEECKEELLETIKVPIKLGLISQKLPKPQYSERQPPSSSPLKRNSSDNLQISNGTRNVRESQVINKYQQNTLPTIIEKTQEAICRSAGDQTNEQIIKNQNRLIIKNEAKGYREDKENLTIQRSPQSHQSPQLIYQAVQQPHSPQYKRVHGLHINKLHLQNHGAAIMSSGSPVNLQRGSDYIVAGNNIPYAGYSKQQQHYQVMQQNINNHNNSHHRNYSMNNPLSEQPRYNNQQEQQQRQQYYVNNY